MEDHLKTRPTKHPYPPEKIEMLRDMAVLQVKDKLLPSRYIEKIVLMGSSVKGTFGEYEKPGFRGSYYSDFDFIVFVDNGYEIPDWLIQEPDGTPFSASEMNNAYRNRKFIEDKYDIEVFFIFNKTISSDTIFEGEAAGIPMTEESQNPNQIIYKR